MGNLIVNSAIVHSLLFAVPIAFALLLKRARCPGWPVLGGVLAGLLLGPGLFGRIAPETYEKLFVGGLEQRFALEDLHRAHQAEALAAEAGGLDTAALGVLNDRHAVQLAEAQSTLDTTRWKHQRPLRSYTATVVLIALFFAGFLAIPPGAGRRPGPVAPLSIGIWSAGVPGGLVLFATRWWWEYSVAEAVLTAAAVAVGPWVLTRVDREAADRAEIGGARMIQTAGRIATIAALAAVGWAMWARVGWPALWALPLAGAAFGWLLPSADRNEQGRRFVRAVLERLFVPAVAASAAVAVEPFEDFSVWLIVVIGLASGDGRWLGAYVGAMLPGGRRSLRTMRLVLGSMACGPLQLSVAAIAAHTWALPGEAVYALVLGAVLIEAMTPARRSMTRRLEETEDEIDELRDQL